ncbi:MAG: glycosyl hydrolase family 18 protein [Asticcacaulis sp.]|uniref:glycosyl hydrolase family 18 protein n=1 Tax=Asticcacaulis sp. TaxID=1872648 RepID=UPI0039E32EC0
MKALVDLIAPILLAVSATLIAMPATARPAPKPVMIGYLPAFKGPMLPYLDTIDLSKVTHINLSFVNPDPQGQIVNGDLMACMDTHDHSPLPVADVQAVIDRAHKAGVKVLASLGGGTLPKCSGDWPALLSADNRAHTVNTLIRFLDDTGLDGLDVDLEWAVLTEIDRSGEYTPFIQALSAALKKRGKLLTCATAANEGGMVPVSSVPYFDYVNIMSYDAIGPDWGTPGDEHATLEMARHDIAVWQARGTKKSQIVLGIPFYGHAFGSYQAGFHDYKSLLAQYGEAVAENDILGKACAGCDYVTYNGRPTIRAKAELAQELGAGLMIWELTADQPGPDSLLDAAYETLNWSRK